MDKIYQLTKIYALPYIYSQTLNYLVFFYFVHISFIILRKKDKKYKTDKFEKLDNIVNELMGDIKWVLSAIIIYVVILLFFIQIDNSIFQDVLRYMQYLIFSIAALAILDLICTAFKLIKICSVINLTIINDDKTENEETLQ